MDLLWISQLIRGVLAMLSKLGLASAWSSRLSLADVYFADLEAAKPEVDSPLISICATRQPLLK
jgi:hypothetical protein